MAMDRQPKDNLKAFLQPIHPVPEPIISEYAALWSPYNVPKRTIMTAPGETERYIYFVLEGIQKSYYLHESRYHVIAFAYAPSFSGIPESFLTQTPSRYYLETITDSRFLRLSYDRHLAFMRAHREIETLYRKATEHFLVGVIQRQHELMAHDMRTRFEAFVRRSPHLLNLVPQKDLASYLGMDATNFSKLMNSFRI